MTLNEMHILRELTDGGPPATGAKLMQQTGIARGTIYVLLNRMQAKGWLRQHDMEYRPTPNGRDAFRQTLDLLRLEPKGTP